MTAVLLAEAGFEDAHLLLQAIDPGSELEQLGAEGDLVQTLFEPVHPVLEAVHSHIQAVHALLEALYAGHEHLVLGLQPVETLQDCIVKAVHLIAEPPLGCLDDALDIGANDLPMELGENLDQFVHDQDPNARPVISGPPFGVDLLGP